MPTAAVIGAQWGDEGKGKIVDRLAEEADLVVRFQGGANAGHTISVEGEERVLHLIPSGIFHEGVRSLVGPGVVVDPGELLGEVESLRAAGIEVEDRLGVSGNAHVIFPYHRAEEAWMEAARGSGRIGTTGRGIGPAYADRISRTGIRLFDLLDVDRLSEKLTLSLRLKAHILEGLPDRAEDFDRDRLVENALALGGRLGPYLADVEDELARGVERDARILLEGAQGTLLDVAHGTYPFVTSSHTIAGGACTGLGMAPSRIQHVLAVVKAYSTRVGEGPFPTELTGETGERLRERGREYGATTGRPRRCGWLDLIALAYAVRLNGVTGLAVTKLDVLDGIEELRVCTGYRIGETVQEFWPVNSSQLREVAPRCETLPGWKASTEGAKRVEDLPGEARRYLDRISESLGVPLDVVSTGPDRGQEVWFRRPW
ncbi:MAG: adenylosuccinate synthase [Nitrospinota bacterium]|nr:adenylosuccinate synthase [Nitrospinota bacterium]HJM41992.1 adenylosuccinate synthase [Nitrospinota bacterium]